MLKWAFPAIILIISSASAAYSANNSASPCVASASRTYFGTVVLNCRDTDPTLLYKALDQQSAARGVFFRVNIINSKLTSLRPQLLGKMVVSEVALTMISLTTIGPTTFSGQENSLNTVTIDKTSLKDVPGASLQAIPKLIELHQRNSFYYKVVTVDSFAHLKNPSVLYMVDLQSNMISSVEKGAFAVLSDLQYLLLGTNNLKELLPTAFAPKGPLHMQTFSLDKNLFETLPIATLAVMPTKANIGFKQNPITNLAINGIGVILQKKFTIDFRHDKMNCSCDFKNFVSSSTWNQTMWFATCYYPKTLNGTFIQELHPQNFTNCP